MSMRAMPVWRLASNTVTAIRTPPGLDARDVIRIGNERFNTSFGSGLAQLAGKVFRAVIWAI